MITITLLNKGNTASIGDLVTLVWLIILQNIILPSITKQCDLSAHMNEEEDNPSQESVRGCVAPASRPGSTEAQEHPRNIPQIAECPCVKGCHLHGRLEKEKVDPHTRRNAQLLPQSSTFAEEEHWLVLGH